MGTMRNWWIKNPAVDLALALIGLAVVFLPHLAPAFLATTAGVSGAMLGTTAVVMGLYENSERTQVAAIVDKHRREVSANWKWLLTGFATSAILALLAVALPASIGQPVIGYAAALLVLRLLRLAWFLSNYFNLTGREQTALGYVSPTVTPIRDLSKTDLSKVD